jgi:hypothetical protein
VSFFFAREGFQLPGTLPHALQRLIRPENAEKGTDLISETSATVNQFDRGTCSALAAGGRALNSDFLIPYGNFN